MYEDMTMDVIMEEMMEEMPDGLDTSEGSLILSLMCKTRSKTGRSIYRIVGTC